ncbi:MAG: GNAT family N-acetyltransferase [Candidatus Bathyarchaeota archaeon]|nr:GNAT family N-acetyltransferase [Candidatus Bathyarchaeota archaeon]
MAELSYEIRPAEEEDLPVLMDLIKQLAVYEKLIDSYTATVELYRKYGFGEDAIFGALLVEKTGGEGPDYLGVALYYYTYSTFTGKPTLYLEDIFVPEKYRGRGIGTRLLVELAKIAVEKDCSRMDWIVLDWNKPSWDFYKNLGAFPLDDWTVFRMLSPEIKKLAEKKL